MSLKREYKVKVLIKPFFAMFKKHYCFHCGELLHITQITHSIFRNLPESLGKGLYFGISNKPIQYTFTVFECSKCKRKLSISDQYYLENPNKKNRLKYDDYHQYLETLKRKEECNE